MLSSLRHADQARSSLAHEDGLYMAVQHVSLHTVHRAAHGRRTPCSAGSWCTPPHASSSPRLPPPRHRLLALPRPPPHHLPQQADPPPCRVGLYLRPLVLGLHCRLSSHARISKRIDGRRARSTCTAHGAHGQVRATAGNCGQVCIKVSRYAGFGVTPLLLGGRVNASPLPGCRGKSAPRAVNLVALDLAEWGQAGFERETHNVHSMAWFRFLEVKIQ